jgi:hypothetical protein
MLVIRAIKAGWISIKISIKEKIIALNYSLLVQPSPLIRFSNLSSLRTKI